MSRIPDACRAAALLLGAVLSGSTLAACGGGTDARTSEGQAVAADPADAAPVPDACGLLPAADLEPILGSALAEPEPGQPFTSGEVTMTSCGWRTVDGRAGVTLGLRRGPQYRPDSDAFSRYAEGFEENMGTRPEVQPVPGLGSAALWDATNHVLMVRPAQAGSELNVQPYLGTKVPMIELAEARRVAEAALNRLGAR